MKKLIIITGLLFFGLTLNGYSQATIEVDDQTKNEIQTQAKTSEDNVVTGIAQSGDEKQSEEQCQSKKKKSCKDKEKCADRKKKKKKSRKIKA